MFRLELNKQNEIKNNIVEKGLTVEISARNLDLGEDGWDVPFAVGWHPYFWFGEEDQSNVDQWKLTLGKGHRIEVDDRLIPTGKLIEFEGYSSQSLKGHDFDTGWYLGESAKEGQLRKVVLENSEKKVDIVIWQEVGKYDYFQIYTPHNRKSIAMEPMSAATNAFNENVPRESNKIRIPAQETWVGSFGVYLN